MSRPVRARVHPSTASANPSGRRPSSRPWDPIHSSRLGPFLRVGCGLGLLWILLQQTSLPAVWSALGAAGERWTLLIVAAMMPGVGWTLGVLRWRGLLASIGVRVPALRLFRALLVASFFNHFLPSTIGGDVVRGWWLGRDVGSTSRSLTVVGLDRLMGLLGFCMVGLLAAVAKPSLARDLPQIWIVIVVAAAVTAGAALSAHPRMTALARHLFSFRLLQPLDGVASAILGVLGALRENKRAAGIALALSMGLQLVIVLQYWILSSALGVDLSLATLAVLVPIVTLVSLLPISINGIGLRESALAVLGAPFGLEASEAVALAWLFLAFQFVWAMAGGVVYLAGGREGGPR